MFLQNSQPLEISINVLYIISTLFMSHAVALSIFLCTMTHIITKTTSEDLLEDFCSVSAEAMRNMKT